LGQKCYHFSYDPPSPDANQRGINLLQYEMQSRDRQNTIPPEVLHHEILVAWAGAIASEREVNPASGNIGSLLFDILATYKSCSESLALTQKNPPPEERQIREELIRVFKERNPKGFPVRKGDAHTKKIVTEKLKDVPIELESNLFDILQRGMETNADLVWDAKRKDLLINAPVIPKEQMTEGEATLFELLFSTVSKLVSKFLDIPPSKFAIADCSQSGAVGTEESSAILLGTGISSFNFRGFRDSANRPISIDLQVWWDTFNGKAKPVFVSPHDNAHQKRYVLVWTSWDSGGEVWVLSEIDHALIELYLSDIHSNLQHNNLAFCRNGDFWDDGCVWYVWVEDAFVKNEISVFPLRGSGPKDLKVIINGDWVKKRIHKDHSDVDCIYGWSGSCLCVVEDLLDILEQDARRSLRMAVKKSETKGIKSEFIRLFTQTNFKHEWSAALRQLRGEGDSVPMIMAAQQAENLRISEWIKEALEGGTIPSQEPTNAVTMNTCLRTVVTYIINSTTFRCNSVRGRTDAWVGDRANDFLLSLIGRQNNLTPKALQSCSAALFSKANLGEGNGREASEAVEEAVGRGISPETEQNLVEILSNALRDVEIPDPAGGKAPVKEVVMRAVGRKVAAGGTFGGGRGGSVSSTRSSSSMIHNNIPAHGGGKVNHHVIKTDVKDCRLWMQGHCHHGNGCKYRHRPEKKGAAKKERSKIDCVDWMTGFCRWGGTCE
jgi:hypothetical protein